VFLAFCYKVETACLVDEMVARSVTVSDKHVEVNEFPRVFEDASKGWEPMNEDFPQLRQEVYQSRYLTSVPVERISGLAFMRKYEQLIQQSTYIFDMKNVFSPEIQGIYYFRKVRACWCQTVPSISVPVSGNEHEDTCHVSNRRIPRKRQGISPQNVCEARYSVTGPLWLLHEMALHEQLVLGLYETPFPTSQSTCCGGVQQ
jgi:hypothetical protein